MSKSLGPKLKHVCGTGRKSNTSACFSHQPKDHKLREGGGVTRDTCGPTAGENLQLKVKANHKEKHGKMTENTS